MSKPASVHGLVVIDKPAGWTSHDVVARCRKVFGQRQVGHSGTLDPDATGVLLVGLGNMTRLLRFLSDFAKAYTAEVVLGTTTSTLDAAGDVVATFDMGGVTAAEVAAAAAALTGDILQVPPMVSAVQIGGKRLHELAREGIEVEREARPVTVHAFSTGGVADGVVPIEVSCSSGTYVRVLAADLGAALGGGAHLRNLRRTAIGPFTAERAVPLEDVGPEHVVALAEALGHLPAVEADDDMAAAVGNGKVLPRFPGPGPWAVVRGGALLAVYEPYRDGLAKPAVVIPRDR